MAATVLALEPMRRVLVTGGNSGIGLALCTQLVCEDGCFVYLGSRSAERGQDAVAVIQAKAGEGAAANVELVVIDVADDASVASAAVAVAASLAAAGAATGGAPASLYGIVNNAGTGLQHKVGPDVVVNVNLFGPRRVCSAFLPLLQPVGGRVVNVGSGAGPMFVAAQAPSLQRRLVAAPGSWAEVEALIAEGLPLDPKGGYGISKVRRRGWHGERGGVVIGCSIVPRYCWRLYIA